MASMSHSVSDPQALHNQPAGGTWSLAVHGTDGDWTDGHLAHVQVFSISKEWLEKISPGDVLVSLHPEPSERPYVEIIRRAFWPLDEVRTRIVYPDNARAPLVILAGGKDWGNPTAAPDDELREAASLAAEFSRGDSQNFVTEYSQDLREGRA